MQQAAPASFCTSSLAISIRKRDSPILILRNSASRWLMRVHGDLVSIPPPSSCHTSLIDDIQYNCNKHHPPLATAFWLMIHGVVASIDSTSSPLLLLAAALPGTVALSQTAVLPCIAALSHTTAALSLTAARIAAHTASLPQNAALQRTAVLPHTARITGFLILPSRD
jgi:hypothetical protein